MRILDRLMESKGQFGREAAARTAELLEQLLSTRLPTAEEAIRLHETALFLRAHPQSSHVARLADRILFGFGERMRGAPVYDPYRFDDPELSGIAGTAVSTNFSLEFARSIAARHPGTLSIDWDNFGGVDRLGVVLGRLLPSAYEEYSVEAHVDWRGWMETHHCGLPWLLERMDPLTYELLEIPLNWTIPVKASRSGLRLPAGKLFYHRGPFLRRADVSIEAEFATPPIVWTRLTEAEATTVLGAIVDASAVRYRELYGFEHPDAGHVYRADLSRGVEIYFFGVPPAARLPLRAYHCGMYFKNGVPMGYVETLSLAEHCEVGFNLYYTFREGETAWLYVRILKLLREQLGVTCFSIDPYQLGHENKEAVASGAFWFYYKLGFRPVASATAKLAAAEAAKIAARPGYRSSAATLRKLAEAPLFYGEGAADWAEFRVSRLRRDFAGLGEEAERTKRGPEEVEYLKLLQQRPDLRGRLVKAVATPTAR